MAHSVSAVVVNRAFFREDRLLPTIAGALFPDVVDKTLAWVLRVTESSHHIAHTPVAAGTLSLLLARLHSVKSAEAFGTAYLLHLISDELHHGRVPWLMPFSNRRRKERSLRWGLFAAGMLLEVVALLVLRILYQRAGASR